MKIENMNDWLPKAYFSAWINGIAQVLGFDVSFNQKDFEPYLNGFIVNPTEWVKVN
jgi:hypothetical protein